MSKQRRRGALGTRPRGVIAGIVIAFLLGACQAADLPVLKEARQRLSYSLGADMGRRLQQSGYDLDREMLGKGIQDGLRGGPTLLTEQEVADALAAHQRAIGENLRQVYEKNRKEGAAFLAEIAKRPGVQTLADAGYYEVLVGGSGESPRKGDTVRVHFRCFSIRDQEIDNSYDRKEPLTVKVDSRIRGNVRGWMEALPRMKVGAKWKLYLPPLTAHGIAELDRKTEPVSSLVYELELLSIEAPPDSNSADKK